MPALAVIKTDGFELTPKLEPDRMKLFVDAKPASPFVPVTRKELISALSSVTKEDLLETGVLDDIAEHLSKGEGCADRRIAKGKPPVPGRDGRLALMVKPFTGKGAPREIANGKVDFRSLHLFDNISAGGIVAKIFPPAIGENGVDATGKVLTAPIGKPIKVSIDKTLRLERPPKEELECIVSNINGYLFDDSGRLTVRDQLQFPSDIDPHTGSIDFIGTLTVAGDVATDYSARGRTGVIINGGIRGAIIESPEGDVVVKGFAFGGPGARVVAGKSVSLASAQELTVEANGDIEIVKHANDCTLRTHSSVKASSAVIIGGHILAVCGGEVGELGNDAGRRTVFQLCNSVEADPAYSVLISKITTHKKAISMIEGHLGPYAKNAQRIALLSHPFREKMEDLSRKLGVLQKSLLELEKNKSALLSNVKNNAVQRVNIVTRANAGVEILCDGEALTLKESVNGPVSIDYDPQTKKFTIGPLQPLVCNVTANESPGAKNEQKK